MDRGDALRALSVDDSSVTCDKCRTLLRIAQACIIVSYPSSGLDDSDRPELDKLDDAINAMSKSKNDETSLRTQLDQVWKILKGKPAVADEREFDYLDRTEPADIFNACMLDQCEHILRTLDGTDLKVHMTFCMRRSNVVGLLMKCYNSIALKDSHPTTHELATFGKDTKANDWIDTISTYDMSSEANHRAVLFGLCVKSTKDIASDLLAMSTLDLEKDTVDAMIARFAAIKKQVDALNIPVTDGVERAKHMQTLDRACEAVCRVYVEHQDPYRYIESSLWKHVHDTFYSAIVWNDLENTAKSAANILRFVTQRGYDRDIIDKTDVQNKDPPYDYRAEPLPYRGDDSTYWNARLCAYPHMYAKKTLELCTDTGGRLMQIMTVLKKDNIPDLLGEPYAKYIHPYRFQVGTPLISTHGSWTIDTDKSLHENHANVIEYSGYSTTPYDPPNISESSYYPESIKDNPTLIYAATVKVEGSPRTNIMHDTDADALDMPDFNCPYQTIHGDLWTQLVYQYSGKTNTATKCSETYLSSVLDEVMSNAYLAYNAQARDNRCTARFQVSAMHTRYFGPFKKVYDEYPKLACLLADALPINNVAQKVDTLLGKSGINTPVDVTLMATLKTLIIATIADTTFNSISIAFHYHVDCQSYDHKGIDNERHAVIRACADMPPLGHIGVRVSDDVNARTVILGKCDDSTRTPCDKCVTLVLERTNTDRMTLCDIQKLPYMHGYFEDILRHMVYTFDG